MISSNFFKVRSLKIFKTIGVKLEISKNEVQNDEEMYTNTYIIFIHKILISV